MFGRNIDTSNVEVRAGVEHFLSNAFKRIYIIIWSYMKLEDVLEVLPMLMLKKFLNEFIFIWGHEQCSKTFGENIVGSYYYTKYLKHVYYACCGLPYWMKDQTLLIDDKPSKPL
jgi:hypothetical protein